MIAQECIDFIKKYESLHDGDLSMIGLQPKMCPAGYWTVGWGHVVRDPFTGRLLKDGADRELATKVVGFMLTEEMADILLRDDLKYYEDVVMRKIRVSLDINEKGALVSFCMNVGAGNFETSTLVKMINMGDKRLAAEQFLRWNKATIAGERTVLQGLVRRRHTERKYFLENSVDMFEELL